MRPHDESAKVSARADSREQEATQPHGEEGTEKGRPESRSLLPVLSPTRFMGIGRRKVPAEQPTVRVDTGEHVERRPEGGYEGIRGKPEWGGGRLGGDKREAKPREVSGPIVEPIGEPSGVEGRIPTFTETLEV